MTIAAQIAHRIGAFLTGLPPEQYAKKKHKSLAGQGEFRWITIGGEAIEGEGNHVGGTPVQIRGSTGEIVKGPDSLTGKKVDELGKSKEKEKHREQASQEPEAKSEATGTAKNPDFDPSQAVKVSADDITKLRQSDVFRVVEWTPNEHRQSVVDYITKERPDLAEEASDVMEELGGSPKSDDKDSVTFQTAGEAASSGKSFAQWSGPISDAFVREEIDDSHPSWKSIQAGTAPTVNEYNDARSLYGQHVTPMNGGKFGKVTELSDDARSANVSHADGSASWHRIDSLHHLGALIESRSKSGGVLSNRMHAEYIAPFLAMESMENGENIGETMKRHGISPLNKDVRNAIVKHKDMMNSEKEVQPSEARKRAMLASARNAEKDNATRVDDRPSNDPVETVNTPEASPTVPENFDHLPMMERLDAHQQAIRNGTATADQVRQWYKWASSPETKEALPQGSFSGSDAFRQTGVNTRLVVVQKSGRPEKYSLSHGIWDAVSSAVDRYAMRQPGLFDESKHPRGDDGRFVTIPASHTFGEMQGEVNRNHDGTATISRVGKSGERDSLVKMHESQVSTFLNDLGGKVESDTRSPDESVNRVLDGNAKFLGRGNDGLAFDTLDGNVVKVSSDVGYHWNNGVRPPGEGATRTKKAAELNNKLKADGVNGLLHHEIVEHDGRTFLKMPKLEIPEKFTQDQLRQITETVKALHANGYSIGDEIQPGVDKHGNAYIYDTGTLSESGRYGVEDDNGHLERLWNKSGMEFGGTDPDLVYQSHFEPAFRLLKNPLRFGEKHWQAHKDRLENAWKNVTPEMKELLSDSHEEAIRGIDRQIKEARARKSENDASNSDQGKSESAQEVLSGRTKPSVPGQQQSLFGGDSPTGQQSLFNIAKPSAKAKPKEVATKIAGRIGDLLAGKETVSPADLTIPLQGESLPGQKTMFSRPGRPIRYEARWVTLGKKGDENRPRIQIEDDGTVKKGPPSLMNENLGDKSRGAERRAKAAHAAVAGKTGKDLTAAKADALAGDQRMQQYSAAKQAAKVAGVSVKEVLSLLPEAQQYLNDQIAEREKSRARARALTGMTAGRIAQVENSHRDWSTVPGFDERSRDVAMEHPELGFDPDDADTPSKVWDLIREGAESSIPLHAPEVAELAATWAKPTKARKQDDLDSVPFSRHATDSPDRCQVSRLKQSFPRGASKKIDDA